MEATLRLLESYREQGFCFHGSQKRIELLEPRQARCESGRVSGCQKAVYASKDCLRVPCIMAMLSPIDPNKSWDSSYSGSEKGKLVVTGTNVMFKPGYIHVLPSVTFREFEEELISFEPVRPHTVIPVTPEILLLMPDLELHVHP